MARWLVVLLGSVLGSLGAANAGATALGFTASLAVQIPNVATIVFPGSGTALINGSAGGGPPLTQLGVGAGVFALSHFVVPATDLVPFPIRGVQVTAANGPGAFAEGGAGFGGAMALNGVAKVCLFEPCAAALANLSVPLGNVGVGGTTFVTGGLANLTIVGAPWTTGTAAVGTITQMGSLTYPGGVGPALTLVTPIFISSNLSGSSLVPAFGILSLHFIPEPGTLALLGVPLAALAALARSRISR